MRPATALFFTSLLLVLAVLPACVSAERTYRRGLEREQTGNAEAAANDYIRALERDASLANVRGRLEVAGREAIELRVRRAEGVRPVEAAEHYAAADDLALRARAVGVVLALPQGFADARDDAFAAAIEELLEQAAMLREAQQYAPALQALDRARTFRPTAAEAAALDQAAREAYGEWAEAEYAAGRFRAAYERAGQALGMAPPGSAGFARLERLREDALATGTRRVALFPAEAASARADLPEGFLNDFNDILLDEYAARPPLFVRFAEPAAVRRLLRVERDAAGRLARPSRTGSLARDLDAHFGVALDVGSYASSEEERGRRTESARLRQGGARVDFTRVERRVTLSARAEFAVVDAASRNVVCSDQVQRQVSDTYATASFDGDYRDLDLSRERRAWFDGTAEQNTREALQERLRQTLAEAVAERVFACLGRQVR
ncbi:MAG: hypothetical protein ACK41D_10740 [Rubricoccaceae bacterium]